MNDFDKKMKEYIRENKIDASHLVYETSCHSVEEAAEAAGVTRNDFVKSICLIDDDGKLIVAIVKGEHKVSTTRVGKFLNTARPRIASPDEILELTGYPVGGTPSFGYEAVFIIDDKVLETDVIYMGGGSEYSLIRIKSSLISGLNGGVIARIRK